MRQLGNYIKSFLSRAGSFVLIASLFSKGFSFIASWIALQFIPNKELGIVLFAYNILYFIIPIGGLGLHQSLIRYGALLKTTSEKNRLFTYTFYKGILATLLLISVIIISSFLIPFQFENTGYYLAFLSIILLPNYVFELIKIQFRLQHRNRKFAYTEIIYSVLLTISVFLLSYYFQEKGYALALVITPLLTSMIFIKKLNIRLSKSNKPFCIDAQFWSYGFFASMSNVVTQLLFAIDIFLIGFIIQSSEMVTIYKYVSLIPLSLIFLPMVFINTDFVTFTENIKHKSFIKNYIKNYMLLFSLISFLLCGFCFLFSSNILSLLDPTFVQYVDSFLILIIGVCGILIFRGLFGNLLSSIGKASVNFYITSCALAINIVSNFYLIPMYGIKGAAITSAALMWLTGMGSAIVFWWLYNRRFLSKG